VPASLPAGEDPAAWGDALALAGLRVGPPEGTGAFVLLHPTGDQWTVVVRDTAGRVQTVQVPRPLTATDRESTALLAASLARPLAAPKPASPAPPPSAPPALARAPRAAPRPAPAAPAPLPAVELTLVEAPPAAPLAPPPPPRATGWSRAMAGLRVGPGSAPVVGVAAGVDTPGGWRLGVAGQAWGPANATAAAADAVRARSAGGELLVGRASASAALELGLGADGRALDAARVGVRGVVPTASAGAAWYPGAARGRGLVVLVRAQADLRMTGVDTASGVARLAPVGLIVGAGLRGAAPVGRASFSQNP